MFPFIYLNFRINQQFVRAKGEAEVGWVGGI